MTKRARAGGIAYEIQGAADAPWLVLGHSLATSGEVWGLQVPLLGRHFRLLLPDWRGHGASEAIAGPYSLADLAGDILSLADHLGIGRFSYMGLSIGGMVGQELAIRSGPRLEKLILCSTLTGTIDAAGQAAWDARMARVAAGGMDVVVAETLERWLSADFRTHAPLTAQWIGNLIRATSIAGYLGCGAAIKAMSLPASSLAAIRLPTLILAGEKDPGATPEIARRIAAQIPGAELRVLAEALHLGNVEKAHAFNEVALDFLLRRA